jgi:hypothetical protein
VLDNMCQNVICYDSQPKQINIVVDKTCWLLLFVVILLRIDMKADTRQSAQLTTSNLPRL